jgi:uncharacterized repeat protein (TIGR01451 family)
MLRGVSNGSWARASIRVVAACVLLSVWAGAVARGSVAARVAQASASVDAARVQGTGILSVRKIIQGPAAGQQGQVTIAVTCDQSQPSPSTLVVPAGATERYSRAFRDLPAGTSCTVHETEDGHTDTVAVEVAGDGHKVTIAADTTVQVDVTDTYTFVSPPEPAKLLTVAARVCPSYADVTANLARNNIQESLKDLGADTLYTSGQPIDPDLEAKGQPNCKPLVGWRFTLGTGYQSRAVSGAWGSLSIVTGAFPTSIVTQESIPLLNDKGQSTGTQIAGAATVELDQHQADIAANPNSLWIQGGTPSDPILDQQYPGAYAFAALRCAVDNLNGDNVEWIGYPTGALHVFCYAYYIQPPPTSGTIVVRKEVTDPAGATEDFTFKGNISFTEDSAFTLGVKNGAPASMTFYRAETKPGDQPWSFAETVPPGWHLTNITCTSQTGGSTTTSDLTTADTTVTLAAGDTVTCTYTDSQTPPKGGLSLTKTTIGGIGTFDYTVTPTASGGGSPMTARATTTKPEVEVAATPGTISLAPGSYKIAESLPISKEGTWTLTAVACGGNSLPAVSPVSVTIVSGAGVACHFENTFVPAGAITIRKKALGNTGTAGFTVYSQANTGSTATYSKTAKVTEQGTTVLAKGDKTDALPLGSYKIQEFAAAGTHPAGWALTSVICNGKVVGSSQGAATVTLTPQAPKADCTFTNTYTSQPPTPTPKPPVDPDPEPVANLTTTKTADRKTVEVGDMITYTIKVSNTGHAAAQGVNIAEQTPLTNAQIISASPSQGTCQTANAPASCSLGTIAPGHTVTIIVTLKATKPGGMANDVAVNSATQVEKPPTAEVEAEVVRPPSPPAAKPSPPAAKPKPPAAKPKPPPAKPSPPAAKPSPPAPKPKPPAAKPKPPAVKPKPPAPTKPKSPSAPPFTG